MSLDKQKSFISVNEYLVGEKYSDTKHEYINGSVYAMEGGSRNHNILTFNLTTMIGLHLKSPCQGYGSDMKIRVKDIFYYPDLSISCQEEATDDYYNEHLVLIIEVLSPSTERIDKYEKFLVYQQIDTLQEYVLVHQDIMEIWIFRRTNQWGKEVYNNDVIELKSITLTLAIDNIYRNVNI